MHRLVIEFDPRTGQVGINGPIDDRMLCYGMIELAKEAIMKRSMPVPVQKSSLVLPVAQGVSGV